MKQRELIETVKARLSSGFGDRLKGVILFGSEARGEAGNDSDIDILALLNEIEDLSVDLRICIDSVYPFSLEIDRRISVKPVSYSYYEQTDCPLFRHARKEGIMG